MNNAAEDEKIDVAVLKYKADLHFAKQDYSEAKILYEKILEANVRPNSSNYRDNSEALIRCLIHLEHLDRAFELSFEMVRKCLGYVGNFNVVALFWLQMQKSTFCDFFFK